MKCKGVGGIKAIYIIKPLSAYQKLKQQNLKLKQDIADILGRNGFEKEIGTRTAWTYIFDLEKQVWSGDVVIGKKDTGEFEDK